MTARIVVATIIDQRALADVWLEHIHQGIVYLRIFTVVLSSVKEFQYHSLVTVEIYPESMSQCLYSIWKVAKRKSTVTKKMDSTVTGLEPAIPRSEVWCLIH